MYCVKCGVELADSEKKCPLCGTPVFHPDIPRSLADPPYPSARRIRREDVNRSGILFVLTVAALLPAILALLCAYNGFNLLGNYRVLKKRSQLVIALLCLLAGALACAAYFYSVLQ